MPLTEVTEIAEPTPIEPLATRAGSSLALSDAARDDAEHALSANTRRAYRSALARLDAYLEGRPLDDAHLAAYVRHLREAGMSPTTANTALAAVGFVARLSGTPSPAGPETRLAMARLRREGKDRGRGQVAGVTWAQADAASALASADDRTLAGLRDAAILALASDAMLRVSEIAAIDLADLGELDDGAGLVRIRSSKTDQEGRGAVAYLGAPTMRRVHAWLAAAGHTSGALFRRVRRNDRVGGQNISARAVRTIITRRAAAAGVEGRVSGHSLRVGAAQSLAAAGASVVEMQVAGRWESVTMPGRYASGQLAARGAVAKFRYGRG